MKQGKTIPCLPGWITAGALAAFGLLMPTYFYVRLMPVLIALVIGLYCLLSIWGKRNPGGAHVVRSLLTTGVILAVLIFTITGGMIFHAGLGEAEVSCPYVVVLGAKARQDGPSLSLMERIRATADYLKEHPQTVAILSGGQGSDEPVSEAQCMYDVLVGMGIATDQLILEDKATSTWENLNFSLDIIEEKTGQRPDTVGVVSSEYHLFRTGLQARQNGLEIVGIPAKTGSFDRWLHYFIREIAGVWHYILLGGQYT